MIETGGQEPVKVALCDGEVGRERAPEVSPVGEENAEAASSEAPACRDGEIAVQIAGDRMAAFITVRAPQGEGVPVTTEVALAKLAATGVVFGIDEEAVRRTVEGALVEGDPAAPGEPILVAQGRAPVAGLDGWIDYHPVLLEVSGRPKLREDGTVNLFDLNLVHNIPTGTVLAVMTPATRGEPGMTVRGIEVPARPGREVRLSLGKGAIFSEDGLKVVAGVDGHATLSNQKISITKQFEVNSDVGVGTGNIEFIGSVVIRGTVQSGFWVKAEGDVEVQGWVDGGNVEAGGNVTVLYGIQGSGRGRVVAGGAVKARFIENAEVSAGSSVWATDGILQSRVKAGVSVEVLGRRGAIIGGQVTAKESVSARNLGSQGGGATEITVGSLPEARDELMSLRKQEPVLAEKLKRAETTVLFLEEQDRKGYLPREKREMLRQLVQVQEQMLDGLQKLKARCHELELLFDEARNAWIQAKEVSFPGVKVTIGNSHYTVGDRLERIRFRLDDDLQIATVPA